MKKGVLAYLVVVIIAAIAESITMEPVTARELPVITLVQNEPVYHKNTEIVGSNTEVNIEKFSNPALRSGDDVQTATVNNQEEAGTSSAGVPTAESKHVCSTNPDRLTKRKGIVTFNGHRETWYDLPMQGVVNIMRNCGFDEASYPYSVCDNCGCKLLGGYIMIAADTYKIERGSIVETSLGTGIVSYHCGRSEEEGNLFDVAVNWQ